MDRMEAIFVALGEKTLPARVWEEKANGTRVLVEVGHYDFDYAVGTAFDQVRRIASTGGCVVVLKRLLEILEHAILTNPLIERRRLPWAARVRGRSSRPRADPRPRGHP